MKQKYVIVLENTADRQPNSYFIYKIYTKKVFLTLILLYPLHLLLHRSQKVYKVFRLDSHQYQTFKNKSLHSYVLTNCYFKMVVGKKNSHYFYSEGKILR